MEPHSFVTSAVLLLAVAAVAVVVFRGLGLGSILGLLVTGIIVGPHTPGPVITSDVDGVRQFTELGVVLLLFLIGLEIKPQRLWALRRLVFGLGSLQVLVSAALIAAYFWLFRIGGARAFLLGACLALSSTAIVVQMLREQGEIASPHGHTAFAILLMQDLAVVPLLALMPVIADSGSLPDGRLIWEKGAVAAGIVGLLIAGGRYVVPKALAYVARHNHREAFFLVALASVLISALVMEGVGMSMALGAFLMGMMLSTSRYSLQIEASMEPHKGLLMSLFFVSVGMSIDISALVARPLEFVMHVLAVMAIKILVLMALCLAFGVGRSAAMRVALMLSQGGEFGFVVLGSAKALGVIDGPIFVTAIAVISLTMLLTPLVVKIGERGAQRLTATHSAGAGAPLDALEHGETLARVVVAGYGRVGHTVGTILRTSDIPYIAFDTDAALVDTWHREGHPLFYGDVCNAELLVSASLRDVELVILTIDDGPKAIRAAQLIRAHLPQTTVIARARDLVTCDELLRAGADQAYPETLEASLRLAAVSLEALGISDEETAMLLRGVRGADYALVRGGPESLPHP